LTVFDRGFELDLLNRNELASKIYPQGVWRRKSATVYFLDNICAWARFQATAPAAEAIA
jgi:hypothetical protein